MVTPFSALTQAPAPLAAFGSKYSISAPESVGRLSTPPTVAVPDRKVGVNTTVPAGALSKLTRVTAYSLAFSLTRTLVILTIGRSSFSVNVTSSLVVPVP